MGLAIVTAGVMTTVAMMAICFVVMWFIDRLKRVLAFLPWWGVLAVLCASLVLTARIVGGQVS